jgi:hypothetical protein
MVKSMENMQAAVELKSENVIYTLPAEQININSISEKLGKSVALQDIKIQIEISTPPNETSKIVESAASRDEFTVVTPPINFTIRGYYGDATVEVSKFNAFVERTIAVPDNVDPQKITTGIVIEPDGTVRSVPTKVINTDGKYYAKVNSLTNSTYSVIWHPIEFKDVVNHWANDAINDLGSRMIVPIADNGIFNPDQEITRAEFADILIRGLGLKPENGTSPFSDLSPSVQYSNTVTTAYDYNLIDGFEDGTFRPEDKITREQAMIIIASAMEITDLNEKLPSKSSEEVLKAYTDSAQISEWARNSVVNSLRAGIVSGRSDSELAPRANITRAEAAAIIRKLLQISELI